MIDPEIALIVLVAPVVSLLGWALRREKFSVSVFSSVAFAAYAGAHLWRPTSS